MYLPLLRLCVLIVCSKLVCWKEKVLNGVRTLKYWISKVPSDVVEKRTQMKKGEPARD